MLRACAMTLVVLSLTIRIAFPPGFMPGQSADGLTIAICTGLGLSTIEVGPDGQPAFRLHQQRDVEPGRAGSA